MKSALFDMLLDSYASTEEVSPNSVFTSPAVNRGSASDRQLGYIERASGGSGDRLAELRFGKSLMELDSVEASWIIRSLTGM